MLKEFKTLLPYFRKYRFQYAAGLLFLLLADGGQVYLPQLVRRGIDAISSGSFEMTDILLIGLQMVGVALLIALGRYFWRYFLQGSSRRIELELRDRVFGHLQGLSSSYYGRVKTGDLMARMTNDMNAIRQATGFALVSFVDGFFMTLAILAIMLAQNARLTLLSISPLPILTAGVIFFGRLVGERYRRVQEGFADLSDIAQESISGVRVLKTFVQEGAFVERFRRKNQDYSMRNMSLVRFWGIFFPAVSFLAGLTTVIFLFLGGRAVMEGSFSPGSFTAFFAYLQMLIWPMLGAGFTINLIQRAGASLQRINQILREQPDIQSPPPERAVRRRIAGAISFRNLTYAYPGTTEPVLQGITLELPRGGSLGILGRTGSGKSTLVQLLPRLLDPPPGTVFLDGTDVRDFDLGVLRAGVSMAPQDNFLFSASIRDNIAFGNRRSSDQALARVATLSTIERDFSTFPDGWNTVVGERGITLSGGQKQRVALSRALAADASVYILDDSLSSVDTETEDAILRELLPFLSGKTLLVISHRISTLKTCGLVLVLEAGRVAQMGSHEELVRRKGFYRDIYRLQQLEEALRQRR
ncbi:MAG: ABC transporter ATP-binding protein [Spirochaetales bacterium]|nr:ABC transporter ATP-binding protein [Spirochaetales bacterium]